ncbi:Plug domain-containing protein [Hyunsoonleella flava]|uniref:Plug domain-containing protein n=1 Tax=Hyunsoonleella flava TaxID=2527939 RepID=A0A4Q9FAF5_9FLAO|nr:Plug domain-containing protein [Hyunsoonleella flava]TBN00843.1 Plug domain-containing protein [Hyunsoonleella flava]
MSKVIYLELIDSKNNIITQQKLYVESTGTSSDIKLPEVMQEGTYTLRAYTKYMLNDKEEILFQKEIPIVSLQRDIKYLFDKISEEKVAHEKNKKEEVTNLDTTKPIVQFFPEGGDLITGLECVLGVKVTDSEGNGLALEGKILDENGNFVSYFNSYEFGLGWTSIKVKPYIKYHLQIPIDGEMFDYPIPSPILKGYALRVANWGEYINITASTNIANGLNGAFLVGHIRGDIIFKQKLKANDKNLNIIKLYTSKLQDGVAHFTLFAPDGEPVSERLTFIDNPQNDLKLSIKTNKQNYNLREKVNIDFTLVETDGKTSNGDFSMSVFEQKETLKNTDNIKTWLLLNSDLGGTISNPNFFFQKEKGRKYLLDLLMLTHGWRRFTWKSLMDENDSTAVSFPPEKGIMINGTTTAFKKKQQPRKAQVTLNIVANELVQEQKLTNAKGEFSFGPFIFQDSIKTVINANSIPISKKNRDRLSIYLEPYYPEVKIKNIRKSQVHTKKLVNTYSKPYPKTVEKKLTSDFEYDPSIIKLDETVVKARKKLKPQELLTKKMNARTLHGEASRRLIPDSIPGLGPGSPTFNMLRYVAGVRVFGTFPNQSVSIRGDAVLFVLDGIRTSPGRVQTIPINDILFIDVLRGSEATIYGGLGPDRIGGVIAIYTKRGDEIQQKPKELSNFSNPKIPGFYKTREFYKPNYAVAKPEHKKPDYRKTLHWEPNIKISNNSPYTLNFYTGDTTNKYVIRIEGITYNGIPVSELYSFDVLDTK